MIMLASKSAACLIQLLSDVTSMLMQSLQVSPESLPAYDTYSDGLQLADDALVQRVALEYWAAFEEIATQHDIKRGDFTKAFRDK